MFSLPSLPQQWEKRLIRYLLLRIDLLEERTLGDLSNLGGSVGRNSVFTLKDVGIKVERLRSLIKIPPRFELKEAVVETLTITLPANLLYSGAVEILVQGVRIAVDVAPPTADDASTASPSPPATPRPGDRATALDPNEFPVTAEDLAQSFLELQSREEREQFKSMYAEVPMTASMTSSTTTDSEDEDEDLGVGTAMGLPGMLANMVKGIADRMIVRIRDVKATANVTLPEDKGGEKVVLELEVDDMDVEGVSRNVTPHVPLKANERPQKEGKRRITLENLRGFITASETMFGMEPGKDSTVFGTASEATEKGDESEEVAEDIGDLRSSKTTLRDPPPNRRSPTPPQSFAAPESPRRPSLPSPDGEGDGVDLEDSQCSSGDRFADFSDSDDEVLAFAPPSMHTSARHSFARSSKHTQENYFDDMEGSDDETEGGAAFSPMPQQQQSPSASVISVGSSSFSSPPSTPLPVTRPIPQPVQHMSDIDTDSSGDEMDPEASRMLSQSMIFSRKEADSLYMSATSGMLRSKSDLQNYEENAHSDGTEEVDAEEMDHRLDKLINGDSAFPKRLPAPTSADGNDPDSKPPRSLRKLCLEVDLVTVYYPSLSDGVAVVPADSPVRERREGVRFQQDQNMPGAMPGSFSMYASRHHPQSSSSSITPPIPHRSPPRVKIVDSVDARPTAPSLETILGQPPTNHPDIEIICNTIRGTVDIHTERMLTHLLELVQSILAEDDESPKKKKVGQQEEKKPKKTVQVIAEEIDVRLINHLGGIYSDDNSEDPNDPAIQLQCLLNDVRVFHKGLAEDTSTSKLSVKKFALNDEEEGIITFLRSLPSSSSRSSAKMSTSHHRKSSSASSIAGGLRIFRESTGDADDISIVFSHSPKKVRVNITTLPLRIRGDLKRLEETFSAFGGVGSVLASTTTSTATIGKSGRPPPRPEQEQVSEVDTKLDCRLGGLVFDVVGSNSKVVMQTSPVKIKFQSGVGLGIEIEKINISGPTPDKKEASIGLEGIKMEFANRPTQDDLARLLELLTPSKDRFDDDDILIDTLLRQREQGSVLRVNVAGMRGELLDTNIFEKLKVLGDEVIKVLTVTDFVAGDERPGILTLVNVEGVYAYVETGGGMGRIEAEMDSLGITHVSAPSLLAMAVGTISVRRNDDEEILGEGIDRRVFSDGIDRPMLMIRMVGEELEPVVKIKFWNIRAEYNVQTLMALMESPGGTTGEELAQEMVESILHLPPKKETTDVAVLGFDIFIKDSVLALNPLDLKSRGLIILSEARLQAALPTGGTVSAGMVIHKANVMVIDDIENLVPAEPSHARGRREVLSEHLSGFASMGYVPTVTISSAKVTLQVVGKAVDVEVKDDLLLIESCADSTQTMMAVFNGLKPPTVESEEIRYCTEVVPVDILASLTEDAFAHPGRKRFDGMENDEDDLVHWDEELPNNLGFVDSYYGRRSPPNEPTEGLTDSMLEEDLHVMQTPSLSREGSGNDRVFREYIEQLDPEPLEFIEEHFGKGTLRRRGKKSLNQEAVDNAEYFPLRIRIRDVHAIFNLHDGYDWQRTRDTISQAVRSVETKAAERRNRRVSFDVDDDEDSVVDDFLFNSIYIGVPANRDPGALTHDINKQFDDLTSETSYATTADSANRPQSSRSRSTVTGDYHHHGRKKGGLKLSRSRHHKMQFELKGVNVDFLLFPPGSDEVQSSVDVRVRDLEIFDNVPTSTWRKFVTYCQESGEREYGSDMIRLECLIVKPVPELAATEFVLKANILPLRLHVDQDTLDFLTRFFEFKDDSALPPGKTEEPFLQRVEVNSVRVKLDYKPKYVDYAGLRSGHTTEFMNFFILEEADMVLRRVILHGISGFPRMSKVLNDTWMPDIQRTQLGGVLAGVAPVRSLVNLGKGARDLVVVPIREYKKDGRIVRSLQKGMGGFVRNTAGELVRLGAKVAVGTQALLQSAEGVLTGGDAYAVVEYGDEEESEHERMVSLYADQPESVLQGLRGASRSLKRNFGEARDAISMLPSEIAASGDARGAVAAVARATPRAVIRPVIGVSEALGRTFMGVGNAMEPERRKAREDKYKKHYG